MPLNCGHDAASILQVATVYSLREEKASPILLILVHDRAKICGRSLRVYAAERGHTSAKQRICAAVLEEVNMLDQEESPRQVLVDPHLRKGKQIHCFADA